VKQAIRWAAGEEIPVKKTIIKVPYVDVREVRTRMRLSQAQFAQRFDFAPSSVRNWEQGRRQAPRVCCSPSLTATRRSLNPSSHPPPPGRALPGNPASPAGVRVHSAAAILKSVTALPHVLR
jgi:DNA-binding XRE family transcriptional regulator